MKQVVLETTVRQYVLQPGDGTRYTFMLVDMDAPSSTVTRNDDGDTLTHNSWHNVAGAHLAGHVIVLPSTGQVTGKAVLSKRDLADLTITLVWWAAQQLRLQPGHLGILAPILAAAGVLAAEPGNLEGACAAMLKSKNLL